MSEVEKHIAEIQQKVQLLLKQHIALQKDYARLQATLKQQEEDAKLKLETIHALTHQNQILKASLQDLDPEEKKQLVSKINGYLKQIDACISLLTK